MKRMIDTSVFLDFFTLPSRRLKPETILNFIDAQQKTDEGTLYLEIFGSTKQLNLHTYGDTKVRIEHVRGMPPILRTERRTTKPISKGNDIHIDNSCAVDLKNGMKLPVLDISAKAKKVILRVHDTIREVVNCIIAPDVRTLIVLMYGSIKKLNIFSDRLIESLVLACLGEHRQESKFRSIFQKARGALEWAAPFINLAQLLRPA